jgi:CspA family cold shock protein
MIGRIKAWNRERGFGFVEQDEIKDIFVHISAVQDPTVGILEVGNWIQFETEPSPKGPRAINVRMAIPEPEPEPEPESPEAHQDRRW